MEDEIVPTNRLQLLDLTTSTRDHVRWQEQPLPVRRATSRRCLLIRRMSVSTRTANLDATLPRRRVQGLVYNIIFQPGRELGLGECPPVRAFTLPT